MNGNPILPAEGSLFSELNRSGELPLSFSQEKQQVHFVACTTTHRREHTPTSQTADPSCFAVGKSCGAFLPACITNSSRLISCGFQLTIDSMLQSNEPLSTELLTANHGKQFLEARDRIWQRRRARPLNTIGSRVLTKFWAAILPLAELRMMSF
jgi:hypothetical protein